MNRWYSGGARFGGIPLLVLALGSCSDSTTLQETVLAGPDVPMGQGFARTEVTVRGTTPVAAAVVMTEAALNGLATTAPMGGIEYTLPFAAGVSGLVFNHVGLNWNPAGHPPPMVYTVPHFDIHFYLINEQQRNTMTPTADPQYAAKAARAPTGVHMPQGYGGDGAAMPRMGAHWVYLASPEHHGQAFTHTMVYGSYDGSLVFVEPMITKAFVESKATAETNIVLPAKFPRAGLYPTSYAIRWDAAKREYRVELKNFRAFD